jgi:hypothetical protein
MKQEFRKARIGALVEKANFLKNTEKRDLLNRLKHSDLNDPALLLYLIDCGVVKGGGAVPCSSGVLQIPSDFYYTLALDGIEIKSDLCVSLKSFFAEKDFVDKSVNIDSACLRISKVGNRIRVLEFHKQIPTNQIDALVEAFELQPNIHQQFDSTIDSISVYIESVSHETVFESVTRIRLFKALIETYKEENISDRKLAVTMSHILGRVNWDLGNILSFNEEGNFEEARHRLKVAVSDLRSVIRILKIGGLH